MKNLILMILLSISSLYAQSFTKHNVLGVWEVSAKNDLRGFAVFGKDFSTTRGLAYTLIFSKNNKVKNKTTGEIYHYEILKNNQLKIYKIKTYNNYKKRDNIQYDIFKISKSFENCQLIKITKKKITGYYRKEGYKWCKVQDYPKATFYTRENYDF